MFQKINEQQARIQQLEASLAKSIAGEEQRAVNEVKLAKRVKELEEDLRKEKADCKSLAQQLEAEKKINHQKTFDLKRRDDLIVQQSQQIDNLNAQLKAQHTTSKTHANNHDQERRAHQQKQEELRKHAEEIAALRATIENLNAQLNREKALRIEERTALENTIGLKGKHAVFPVGMKGGQ